MTLLYFRSPEALCPSPISTACGLVQELGLWGQRGQVQALGDLSSPTSEAHCTPFSHTQPCYFLVPILSILSFPVPLSVFLCSPLFLLFPSVLLKQHPFFKIILNPFFTMKETVLQPRLTFCTLPLPCSLLPHLSPPSSLPSSPSRHCLPQPPPGTQPPPELTQGAGPEPQR